jgi:Protein of unknown function (DUF1488)
MAMRVQTFTLRGQRSLWRPAAGEQYFTILADGNVRQIPWHGTPFDYDAWQFGNCFRKRAEAKQAREQMQALLLIFHEERWTHHSRGQSEQNAVIRKVPIMSIEFPPGETDDISRWIIWFLVVVHGKPIHCGMAYQALRTHFDADVRDPMPAFVVHRARIEALVTDFIRQGYFGEDETIVIRAHDLRRSEDTGTDAA